MPVYINSLLPQGHYRAGKYHSPEGKPWKEADFTPAQWQALRADPHLMVGDECTPDGSAHELTVETGEPAPVKSPERGKKAKK